MGTGFTASGRISAVHILIVTLSMTLMFGAWHHSTKQAETRIEQRFSTARDRIVGLISDRMQKYEDALWSGVAAIESHGGDMSLTQWRVFAENLRIDEKYPGINGIGVIHFLSEQSVDAYLEQRRIERPGFQIHPSHDQNTFMPISFIEPENRNAAAVGLDIAHELNRRTAALASRDTGLAQITGPIVLVQDSGATPGFLFYAPYYSAEGSGTVGDRADNAIGAVYAPFVVRNLLDGLLAQELRHISISISDDGQTIYDEHSSAEALHDPDPMFTETVRLDLYGRTWSFDIRSNLAFRENNTYIQPTVILVSGIIIEGLIICLLILMARANHRAVAYAEKVTAELRGEKQKLVRTNEELEQFAYAASHDLKTPIRGICGLTEMLIEDLDEYLSSPETNPEIALSLGLIMDRVHRMNELTDGIIEFSRVGTNSGCGKPLDLSEFAVSLASDFDLAPDQVVLETCVEQICTDPLGFRRVVENLVGNAVKYHGNVQSLKIGITCKNTPKWLEVSVADNGPGIDRKYHGKIFDIFQTLRETDAPESTGIGLAIVKKAVEGHGGKVDICSNVGEGACFSFQWPKDDLDTAMPAKAAA